MSVCYGKIQTIYTLSLIGKHRYLKDDAVPSVVPFSQPPSPSVEARRVRSAERERKRRRTEEENRKPKVCKSESVPEIGNTVEIVDTQDNKPPSLENKGTCGRRCAVHIAEW